MGLNLAYLYGQTTLEEEEKEGLKIPTVTTKRDLDEFEQKNIEQAVQWTIGRKVRLENLMSESFVRSLHKRMYGEVWLWAGEFRKTEKNIGIESWKIATELRVLLDDAKFCISST